LNRVMLDVEARSGAVRSTHQAPYDGGNLWLSVALD